MEWQILNGYLEEVWEARWVIPALQLIMVSAIIIIGTAVNMIMKRKWLEGVPIGYPINAKEGNLCTGESHYSG